MNTNELTVVLKNHILWLDSSDGGKRANLRGANLRYADLRGANLSDADLRGANLSDADLRDANLSDVDLRDANMSGANMGGAVGQFVTFSVFQHTAIFTITHGHIGCRRHPLDVWLANYANIGKEAAYDADTITRYGVMIRFAVSVLRGESR